MLRFGAKVRHIICSFAVHADSDVSLPQVELAIPTEGLSAGDTRDVEG